MEPRISVITLGVANLERSQRFYEKGLGLQLGAAEEQVRFFQLNGLILSLYPCELLASDVGFSLRGGSFSGISLAYNTRSREDVDAVLQQAEAAGGRIVKPAQTVFWGGYSGYFSGPRRPLVGGGP